MKTYKKYFLILTLIFAVFSISCACADNSTDFLTDDDYGSFSELNEKIASQDIVELDKNYMHDCSDNNLTITKSVTMDCKGHTIHFNDSDTLHINSTEKLDITIKNATFRNLTKISFEDNLTHNMTLIDCYFMDVKNNQLSPENPFENIVANTTTTGNISYLVRELATLIVGNTTGLDAAKKLVSWIGKNIMHEGKSGFYQSPAETLFRGVGNCCCQIDLFLQMCEVVNITRDHEVYYVHTGYEKYGTRHFFAVIDNICIDVDKYPEDPWGHCQINREIIYTLTKYPYLPLIRGYD